MEMMIRDDIIPVLDFTVCKFYFNDVLELIERSYGYAFKAQISKYFGHNMVTRLLEADLVGENTFNSFEYIYLKDKALRYVTYKDSPICYTGIKKNKLSISTLSDEPSNKTLIASACTLEVLKAKGINCNYSINKTVFNNHTDKFISLNYPDKKDLMVKKIKGYSKNAKIQIELYKNNEGLNGRLYITDYGANIRVQHYLKSFIEVIQLINPDKQIKKLDIYILSYSTNRANSLKKEFENLIKDKFRFNQFAKDIKYNYEYLNEVEYKVTILKYAFWLNKIIGKNLIAKRKGIAKNKLIPITLKGLSKEHIEMLGVIKSYS